MNTYIPEMIVAFIFTFISEPSTIRNFRLASRSFSRIGAKYLNKSEANVGKSKMDMLLKLIEFPLFANNYDSICQLELLFYDNYNYNYNYNYKNMRKTLIKTISLFYNDSKWLFNELNCIEFPITDIHVKFQHFEYYYTLKLNITLGERDYLVNLDTSSIHIDYSMSSDITIMSYRYPDLIINKQPITIDKGEYTYTSLCGYEYEDLSNVDIIIRKNELIFDKYDDFEELYQNPKKKKISKCNRRYRYKEL